MRTTKKILSMILAFVLVLGLLPATAFASTGKVYISVSYDGTYIDGANGNPIAYIPVAFSEIASINLEDYGLDEYVYDENGDGTADITALHLVIYAHENLYGGSWDDVLFTGAPGSSYFQGGIFGFDENLNYYLNGEYPLAGEGWGATSDQIALEAGDFLDIASFSSWDFYMDSNYGFHFFANNSGAFTHAYSAEAGTPKTVKLVRSYSGMGSGATVYDEADYEISYGTALYNATDTVTTDSSGCAEITFPSAGTWYLWADGGYGAEYPASIVSAPAYAKVTVTAAPAPTDPEPTDPAPTDPEPNDPAPTDPEPTDPAPTDPAPEQPRQPQSVSTQLNATMAQLASTVTEPVFGTTAGEWTVLNLARGGYYAKDNAYFTGYYDRIVATVNETAASVNMNGALHKSKSTENSRLIVALSAIGKNATSVGNWDLVEAYSANGFSWIQKQGLNGTIWTLIALDSNNYETSDETIRQQCVDAILAAQHDDGGWALTANTTYASDPDVTGMVLTALYPYRAQAAVAAACEEGFACLSAMQHENGIYESMGSECAESCAWVIVACTTWGINPDTDSRFIKNGNSVVDGLLAHYLSDSASFQHIIGAGSNAMATDQSCYALVAYDRFLSGENALFDYSDVTFEKLPDDSGSDLPDEPEDPETPEDPDDPADPDTPDQPDVPSDGDMPAINASLGLPAEIESTVGTTFNAIISINNWDNTAKLKLIDFLMTIPQGLKVTGVTSGDRLFGGSTSYHMDENGNLRCVYFDANENNDLTVSGTQFPAEVFTVSFEIAEAITSESLTLSIEGMSVKLTSDSTDERSMIVVNTDPVTDPDDPEGGSGGGSGNIGVVTGISFSAVELYTGDDVDLIPSTKKAVAVAVTGITKGSRLTYNDGINQIELLYNAAITEKTGISAYVALVDSTIETKNFINKNYFTIGSAKADTLTFGDSNNDSVINAQDALAAVDAWLRKGDAPTDTGILTLNVNGDSRINTFDALGIVETFVNGSTYGVVTKAATLATKS